MTEDVSAYDAALVLARELERRGLPYAIGGALAFGVWSNPRNTNDVDLNIFVDDSRLDEAFAALEAAGTTLDRAQARRDSARQGMFVGQFAGYRIDVFTPSIDFSHEAARTRRRVTVGDEAFDFLSPEAIGLFKLMFFRGKDRVDLERLVASQPGLDRSYVRAHLLAWFKEDDARVKFWDALVAQFPP
mgnify:CR=1 FL=1